MEKIKQDNSTLVAGAGIDQGVGVCIKDGSKVVKFQNDTSIAKCGAMKDQECTKGCMDKYEQSVAGTPQQDGIYSFLDVNVDGAIVDTAVVKSGDTLTTIFHQRAGDLEDRMNRYSAYHLSKREVEILKLVLERKTRKEITQMLCISLSTLKTHMNNIYKKLPADMAAEVQSRKF